MNPRSKIIIVNVVGAESCRRLWLDELSKEFDATVLNYSYRVLSEGEDPEATMEKWLLSKNLGEKNIIVSSGLPPACLLRWCKRVYPEVTFKQIVWEIHHREQNEEEILRRRSLSLFLDGILGKAEKFQALKDHELVRHTPLKIAIEHVGKKELPLESFFRRLTRWQLAQNHVHIKSAVVCREGFNVKERDRSILSLRRLLESALVTS